MKNLLEEAVKKKKKKKKRDPVTISYLDKSEKSATSAQIQHEICRVIATKEIKYVRWSKKSSIFASKIGKKMQKMKTVKYKTPQDCLKTVSTPVTVLSYIPVTFQDCHRAAVSASLMLLLTLL